jgi:putative transposase
MGNIRRIYLPGVPVFITTVCYRRRPFLRSGIGKALLLSIMRELKAERPYRMLGYVILDDHFHWLIVPRVADDFPHLMQSLKLRYARRSGVAGRGESVWQGRYWDHMIRDEHDLSRHLDYIHFNPVKHGCADAPSQYPWTSFAEHVRRGRYDAHWGSEGTPDGLVDMEME